MIPVNRPTFVGNELMYVTEALKSGWISSESPYVEKFEKKYSDYFKMPYATSVANGTVALELAVRALDLKPNDEIILPSFSIISCVLAVIRGGATPVLVDIDPITWNISPSEIEKKVTSKTRAILIVHTYGLPCDMDEILRICKLHKLKLIEDNAEGVGLTFNGKICGSFGDLSITSLYANKHITAGEGGLVFSKKERYIKKIKYMKNLCFNNQNRFVHEDLGWNYRMTGLQAAVGLAQIENIDYAIKRKLIIGSIYNQIFKSIKKIQLPFIGNSKFQNIYWVYGIVLQNKGLKYRNYVTSQLKLCGVETRPFFWPTHLQPALTRMGYFKNESYPVSELIAKSGFYLPSGTGNTDAEIRYAATQLIRILEE
jgi:perosamine synthetase